MDAEDGHQIAAHQYQISLACHFGEGAGGRPVTEGDIDGGDDVALVPDPDQHPVGDGHGQGQYDGKSRSLPGLRSHLDAAVKGLHVSFDDRADRFECGRTTPAQRLVFGLAKPGPRR